MKSKDVSGPDQFTNIRFRLKALDVGLWDYDIDNDVIICDRRWYDLLGREFGSVRAVADFLPLIHPDDAFTATNVDYDKLSDLIVADERYHVDFRIIRPDGEIRWWRSVACILVDPATGQRTAIGCVTDNTEFRLLDPRLAAPLPDEKADDPAVQPNAADDGSESAVHPGNRSTLSGREIECLSWVSVGKTAWETAIIMGRSQRTVEFHLVNAMRKLSASNKIHAAVIAVRMGLI